MAEKGVNWDSYVKVASISDVGMRRANNQDNLAIVMANSMERWKERGHLFIVADGMGAHAAGELASEISCEQIPQLYSKYDQLSPPEALKKAVIEANAIVNRKGLANEEFFNMGTTCSILTLLSQGAVVAHIGDSRVYRMRGSQLSQLTFDHSLVWEMKASGQLSSEDEAANLVPKNVITRSLGPYPDVKVDLEGPFPIEKGDTFLLCSDGLTGLVQDDELGAIIANLPPEEAVQVLTDLTNLRGGPDNITIIIAQVVHDSISTARSANKPLTIGAKKTLPVHPIAWACFASAIVAAVLLGFLTSNVFAALIPGVLALITLMYILIRMGGVGTSGVAVTAGKRFGRAPYTRADCASGDKLVDKLKQITTELRDAAQADDVDTGPMDKLLQQAGLAFKAGKTAEAIKFYARSISTMMDQFRRGDSQRATDSSVDL